MVFVVARVEVVVGVRRHVVLEVIEVEVGGVKVEVLAGLDVEVWFSVELLDGVQGVLGIRCGFVLGILGRPWLGRVAAGRRCLRGGGFGRGAVFLFGMVLVVVSWGAEAGLTDRAAGLVARFAGGEPLADFAAVRLAPVLAPDAEAAGDLVAVRFTGSSVAVLALVAATYTPSVVTHFRLGLGVRNRKCLLCRMSALISA